MGGRCYNEAMIAPAPTSPSPPAIPWIAVVGPTASGKTELAVALAQRVGGEVISTDSMQVYRGMDIGTAKPNASEQAEVRHHLIDVTDPDDDYHLGRFQVDAAAAFADIRSRGKVPVLVGGTGLYLRAVTDSRRDPQSGRPAGTPPCPGPP